VGVALASPGALHPALRNLVRGAAPVKTDEANGGHDPLGYEMALARLSLEADVTTFSRVKTLGAFSLLGANGDLSVYMKTGKSSAVRVLANPPTKDNETFAKVTFADRQEVFLVGCLIAFAPIYEGMSSDVMLDVSAHETNLRFVRKVEEKERRLKKKLEAEVSTQRKKEKRRQRKMEKQHTNALQAANKVSRRAAQKIQKAMQAGENAMQKATKAADRIRSQTDAQVDAIMNPQGQKQKQKQKQKRDKAVPASQVMNHVANVGHTV
jgi:flagellar biosynthesis GTPase FlhF